MKRRIFYILLAGLMWLCLAAGCAAKEGPTEGVQELEQDEKQERTEKESCILPDTGLPNYIPVLAEWQEVASDGGYFVTVDQALFGGTVTPEVFAPVCVSRVVKVEGCDISDARGEGGELLQLSVYAIETEQKGQDVLNALQSLEFVDFVWENTYDYRAVHYSVEPKCTMGGLEDINIYFFGTFSLSIDEAFDGRLFTPVDFPCLVSVEWSSYEAFKQGSKEQTRQKFTVSIRETGKQSMLRYLRVLGDLAFVQNCTPYIDVLGTDGCT